jgi:hypothetical protein
LIYAAHNHLLLVLLAAAGQLTSNAYNTAALSQSHSHTWLRYNIIQTAARAGREVAVKVIDHDTEAQAAVTNEVELMLSFNHPNIVSVQIQ